VGSILIVGGGFLGSELAVAIASRGKNTENGCQQVWGGGELVKGQGKGEGDSIIVGIIMSL